MATLYDIYCDESCHLEHDKVNDTAMVIGGIWCPDEKKKAIFDRIREIKQEHGISRDAEIKWNKVSPAQYNYYLDLVDYFFENSDLHFRAVVIPDKRQLNHELYHQTHDDFYYKMYFRMLKGILDPGSKYAIYLDIKDTRSQKKVDKLYEYLRNSQYDFNRDMILRVQQVRSHEIELIGLTDLLIGALSYLHRGLNGSEAKVQLIKRIKELSGYSLIAKTLYREDKFNLFIWSSQNGL